MSGFLKAAFLIAFPSSSLLSGKPPVSLYYAKTASGVCHPDLANLVPTCRKPLRDHSHDFIIYMVHIVILNTAGIIILM